MKGYCILILIAAVVVFYQKDPLYTFVLLGVGVIGYMIFKARKSGSGFFGGFLSGKAPSQERNMEDLISLIMLQQLLSDNNSPNNYEKTKDKEREKELKYLNQTQKEITKMLESD